MYIYICPHVIAHVFIYMYIYMVVNIDVCDCRDIYMLRFKTENVCVCVIY